MELCNIMQIDQQKFLITITPQAGYARYFSGFASEMKSAKWLDTYCKARERQNGKAKSVPVLN
jgi:hypothetical protein